MGSPHLAGAPPHVTAHPAPPHPQDALIDSIKKSKLHFVHCFLPKAGGGGDPPAVPCRRVSGSELELPAEHCEAGLMQLDVPLLRAQLRGSRLLDALRMYRQGERQHRGMDSTEVPAASSPWRAKDPQESPRHTPVL